MKIAIDIDGTITKADYFILTRGVEYGWNIKKNAYELEDIFGVTKDEVKDFWRMYYLDLNGEYSDTALPNASDVITKWHDNGNEIFIITSRDDMDIPDNVCDTIENITFKWLQYHNFIFDHIAFRIKDKAKYIKENNIDILIEDKPEHLIACKDICKVYAIDSSYNKNIPVDIIRIKNWNELDSKIK